jgi:hypothetical protein
MIKTITIVIAMCLCRAASAWADSAPWTFDSPIDPMTDTVEGVASTIGPGGSTLAFVCRRGEDNHAMILAQASRLDFAIDETRSVTLRIDSQKPASMTWVNSHSGAGAFVIGSDAVTLAKVFGAAQARIIVDTGREGPRIFSVQGAMRAIIQALQACHLPT